MDDNAQKGHLHPVTQTILEMYRIFRELGFQVVSGPELETSEYNFDKLNFPKNHPARDMQDTFWLDPKSVGEDKLMRTHTSPVQVRFAEGSKPPMRIIVPGKVYRNEATDSTHEVQFHQLEGMYIDKEITMAHLKGIFDHFVKEFFGDEYQVRMRPSFFPFTEPSIEIDISKDGENWIEVLGAGLMNPNVIKSAGLDPSEWKGLAFGMGVDRMLMMKFGVDDVRSLYNGDLRIVSQF